MSSISNPGSAALRSPSRIDRAWVILPPVAVVLAVLLAWEAGARLHVMPEEMPPMVEIVDWLAGQASSSGFWAAVGQTLVHWSLGLALGTVVGLAIGLLIGSVPLLYRLFELPFELLRPIPAIVYLPLLLLVMGASSQVAVLLAAVGALWPVMFQTYYGVREVDPVARETARAFSISGWRLFAWVILPSLLPYLATGIRIASSLALVVAVSIELVGGIPGIGAELTVYATNGIYVGIWGLIVVTGLLGLALNLVLERIERSSLAWHPSQRGTAS